MLFEFEQIVDTVTRPFWPKKGPLYYKRVEPLIILRCWAAYGPNHGDRSLRFLPHAVMIAAATFLPFPGKKAIEEYMND